MKRLKKYSTRRQKRRLRGKLRKQRKIALLLRNKKDWYLKEITKYLATARLSFPEDFLPILRKEEIVDRLLTRESNQGCYRVSKIVVPSRGTSDWIASRLEQNWESSISSLQTEQINRCNEVWAEDRNGHFYGLDFASEYESRIEWLRNGSWTQKNPLESELCQTCKYFHGKSYGGNYLHCSVHPPKPEDVNNCGDYKS